MDNAVVNSLSYAHRQDSFASSLNPRPLSLSPTTVTRRYQAAFRSRRIDQNEIVDRTPFHLSTVGKVALRRSYWIFLGCFFLWFAGTAVLLVRTYLSVPKHKYCLVLNEQFADGKLDPTIWQREVRVDGYGNGEFEWTTDSSNNSFVEDGKLFIVPTLTADVIGEAAMLSGGIVNLTATGTCTGTTTAECVAISNMTVDATTLGVFNSSYTMIPPIQSARLSTNISAAIRFGRVEVKVKNPTCQWCWPAIWMLPRNSTYGDWPRSGEIDIMESRGNEVTTLKTENRNAIRSTAHWGPDASLDGYWRTSEAQTRTRTWYNARYSTLGLDWDSKGLYTWEGTRARPILKVDFSQTFWKRGGFLNTIWKGITFTDPWKNSPLPEAAPFDQEFFLIMNVAVGGTNGFFPDAVDKPWSNQGATPAYDFWQNRAEWLPTWPTDPKERGMAIEYVKMWRIAEPGEVCEA